MQWCSIFQKREILHFLHLSCSSKSFFQVLRNVMPIFKIKWLLLTDYIPQLRFLWRCTSKACGHQPLKGFCSIWAHFKPRSPDSAMCLLLRNAFCYAPLTLTFKGAYLGIRGPIAVLLWWPNLFYAIWIHHSGGQKMQLILKWKKCPSQFIFWSQFPLSSSGREFRLILLACASLIFGSILLLPSIRYFYNVTILHAHHAEVYNRYPGRSVILTAIFQDDDEQAQFSEAIRAKAIRIMIWRP